MAKVGWNVNVAAGLGYAITSTVMPVIEANYGWGYGQGMMLERAVWHCIHASAHG